MPEHPEPSRVTDHPAVALHTAVILDRVFPVLNRAMEFVRGGDLSDDELTHWMNGAIYGVVAMFVTKADPDTSAEEIAGLFGAVSEVIDDVFSEEYAGDFDRYATDALARAEASHA